MQNKIKKKIFFIHIPKTAGISVRKIFESQYDKEEMFHISGGSAIPTKFHYEVIVNIIKNIDNTIIPKINFISGHVPFESEVQKFENFKFITFLRDPIQRVISDYFYVISTPDNALFHIVKDLSLKEYVTRNMDLQIDNLQTRFLSGKITGEITKKELDQAKYNLTNHFAFFGLTEDMSNSVSFLSHIFKWKNIPQIPLANITKRAKHYTQEDVEVIKKFNEFDLELYEFVKKRFYDLLESNLLNLSLSEKLIVYKINKKQQLVRIIKIITQVSHP